MFDGTPEVSVLAEREGGAPSDGRTHQGLGGWCRRRYAGPMQSHGAGHSRHAVVVIGAGQSGLAAAHYLAARGIDFAVIEAHDRVGDNWRTRYDSLRLYTPARYDGLPGLRFPLAASEFPTGRQMGDYLESYVERFDLPVHTGAAVTSLRANGGGGYVLTAGERSVEADQVIVAAGFFRQPFVPSFASELDPTIRQVHSSDYRNPSELADGPVLVVGLSHSGADVAMEAAAGHQTILSGAGHGQLPFSVDSRVGRFLWPLLKLIASNVLTIRTPIGRRMAARIQMGGPPLLRYRRPELLRAGVELVDARTIGVQDGQPLLADGRVLDVANVIWCTGFRPDFNWIELPIFDGHGMPAHSSGVATDAPGLYFLGLPFQYGFTSMLVVGAARDAKDVVQRLAARLRPADPSAADVSVGGG